MIFDGSLLQISHAGPAERALSSRGSNFHDSHQIHRIWKRPQQEQDFDGVKKVV